MSNLDPGRGRPNRYEANTPGDMASAAIGYLISDMPTDEFEDQGEAISARGFSVPLRDGSVLTAVRSQWPHQSVDYLRVVSIDDGMTESLRWDSHYPDDDSSQTVENFAGNESIFRSDTITDENWRWANEKLHEALITKLAAGQEMQRLVKKVHRGLPYNRVLDEITAEMSDVCQLTGLDPQRMAEVWDIAAKHHAEIRSREINGEA